MGTRSNPPRLSASDHWGLGFTIARPVRQAEVKTGFQHEPFSIDLAQPKVKVVREARKGMEYVDYKGRREPPPPDVANGKIYARKRVQSSARNNMIATAIKRAQFVGLLPYTSATL